MNQDSYWIRLDGIDFNLAHVILVSNEVDGDHGPIAHVTLIGGSEVYINHTNYQAWEERWVKYMEVMTRRWVNTTSIEMDKVGPLAGWVKEECDRSKADEPDELQKIANKDRLRYDREREPGDHGLPILPDYA